MKNQNLNPYFVFWQMAFGLEGSWSDLDGLHFTSNGSYLAKDDEQLYLLRTEHITILAAKAEYRDQVKTMGLNEASHLTEENLKRIFPKLTKIYDDIDHHLQADQELKSQILRGICKELTKIEHQLVSNFFSDCNETERDATEPNLETDIVCGLFEKEELVSLASYYIIPGTLIADLSIVTKRSVRGQGYAKSLLNSLVPKIISAGLYPRYRANKSNSSTLFLAKSLGFIPHCSIQVFSIE